MAKVAILSYIKRKSPVHELTGTTKLIFFIAWSIAAMVTYDTRVLLCMLVISVVVFRISRIRIRDISVVLGLAAVFLLLNNLFVYLFAPEYGVELYESRTVLFTIAGPYTVTLQQLFYHLNMTMKVICVVPVALLFIACTDPSEFAASLASIGVSYRIGYSVSLALRYIPDVQREYHNISQAQQARGIDLSGKDKLFTRMKNSVAILLPLILSSLNRIETVSNAMELRGFGKNKKRTWYARRKMRKNDWLVIGFVAAVLLIDLVVTFWDGSRYYNPFV
ncbi:MAG: energy-coupling factor transporter transmembrane protein EcfT [Lachnospiraceae bacterium]|nr:energy-coupling factor transporter transmembrane protein EcfT [Lachnospiraceae bacterium]